MMWRHFSLFCLGLVLVVAGGGLFVCAAERPNVVLVMADDQGWGDVGFRGQTRLQTPTMDKMAAEDLLLERFYAAAPVCSPTRGSLLTGRHPNRFGCFSWGHSLRPQEETIAEAVKRIGYVTGHFGKWHLGSLHPDSPVNPGNQGFDSWFSSPNFFDNDPLMCHNGKVVHTHGEGSKVTVDAAIQFIRDAVAEKQQFLAVVWFGSPHSPHVALKEDRDLYADLPARLQNFYGEITAMDRAIGQLRSELTRLGIDANTLFWYNSDNGAIPVGSTGGLSGRKGNLYEGGLRVPAMIHWPARIKSHRVSQVPCGTVDIYPTVLDVVGAPVKQQTRPLDGISLVPLIDGKMTHRDKPMGFWVYPEPGIPVRSTQLLEQLEKDLQSGTTIDASKTVTLPVGARTFTERDVRGSAAWLDNDWKLLRTVSKSGKSTDALFNLVEDPQEKTNRIDEQAARAGRMEAELKAWQRSVIGSLNENDFADRHP